MAVWCVYGLNRETGEPKTLLVEAKTEGEAIKDAGGQGFVVERVQRKRSSKKMFGFVAAGTALILAGILAVAMWPEAPAVDPDTSSDETVAEESAEPDRPKAVYYTDEEGVVRVDNWEWSSLFWRRDDPSRRISDILEKHPPMVNAIDESNQTALWNAAKYGHKDSCLVLLANGADPNAGGGTTAFEIAIHRGDLDLVKQFVFHGGSSDRALNLAASHGRTDLVLYFIQQRHDINGQDATSGDTPLHDAAYSGHLDVVSHLLDFGARVNVENRYGKTALDYAMEHGHSYITSSLKARGARLGSGEFNADWPPDDKK